MERGFVWLRVQRNRTAEFIGKSAEGEECLPTTAVVDAFERVDEDATSPLRGVETAPTPVRDYHPLQRLTDTTRAWLTKFFQSSPNQTHKKKTPISGGRLVSSISLPIRRR